MSSLEDIPAPLQQSSWTDQFSFSDGVFDISSLPIRYFLTSVPLAALSRTFKLVEDIPGSEDWGYNAIFQRDIDEERVREELLNDYLLVMSKAKFFNPLTIALLPYEAAERRILDAYRGEVTSGMEGRMTTEQIDGIEIVRSPSAPLGNIRWDTNRIVAPAIDGQHRLSALLKFAADPPSGIDPARSQIPVILLLFNKESGGILAQVREIFVDINKTAKPVSKSREILLDDRDPFAILARDLIFDRHTNPDGLPYEVVDWRRDSYKPDAANQITSLLVLYQCVARVFTGRVKVLDALLQLNETLRSQSLLEVDHSNQNCISNARQLRTLVDRFRPRHKQFILTVFRKLEPFKRFLDLVTASLGAEHGHYLKEFLFKPEAKRPAVRAAARQEGVDQTAVIDAPIRQMQQLKDNNDLLYFSIGQRGLFYWFAQLHSLYRAHLSTVDVTEIAESYVEDLNFLHRIGFFQRGFKVDDRSVWEGLCLQGDRLVPTNSAAERIGALILLSVATFRLPDGQTVHRNRVIKLTTAINRIIKGYAPLMDTYYEEETERLEDVIEDDDLEDDEEAEDSAEIDLSALAQERLDTILRWVKSQRTAT